MREQHEQRMGKLLFLTHTICTIFMTIGLISQLMMSGMEPIRSIAPLIINILVFVCGIFVYLKRQPGLYPRYLSIGYSALYAIALLTSSSASTYPYLIPFLLGFVLILDQFATRVASIVFVLANLIRIMLTMATAANPQDAIEGVMIEAIITILVTVGVNSGIKHLAQFFNDSIAEIAAKSDQNEAISGQILDVATDVEEKSERIREQLEVILEASEQMNTSMSNISDGITGTTEAIVNQTTQTQDIQDSLHEANDKTAQVAAITAEARHALTEGSAAMKQLFTYVSESIGSSEEMHNASLSLQEKSNEVRGITSIILGISSQTNLLALNASIEAARAGEAGRGFSVVADEIRNLAEQTRTETENITSLIDQLSAEAQSMIEKVEVNVSVSNQENECATEASSKFDEISAKVSTLAERMEEISSLVAGLLESNNVIVDNVNTLSATSEEITASTQEAVETSAQNVTVIREFADSMSSILQEIRELKSFTE